MYQEDITDLKWKTEQQVCKSHHHQYYVRALVTQCKWLTRIDTDDI